MTKPKFKLTITLERTPDGTKVLNIGDRIKYVKNPGERTMRRVNPPTIRPGQEQEPRRDEASGRVIEG